VAWLLVALFVLALAASAVSLATRAIVAEAVTVAAAVASLGLAIAVALSVRDGSTLTIAGHWLRIDALGAVFLLATGFLYAVGAVFSIGYLRADARRRDYPAFARRYFALFNLFGWTMLLVPLMNDYATLWIAVELTTIVSVLLVALDRTEAALEAAWKYIVIASVGLGLALLGIVFLYAAGTGKLGNAYLPRFATLLRAAPALPSVPVKLAFLLATLGFGTKAGFVPMHTWLPDAHSEAPSSISAMLSGALLVNAFYAVLRFFQVTSATSGSGFPRHVLLVFGVVSLALASLYVLRQESYKRLLAYSSIEHMGVIALGIGFGAPIAVAGALLHVLNHAATKSLAFFGAGSILRRYDTKRIEGVRGAATILPASGPMFLVAALALSGLPVSGIFRSEFQIVSGGFARPAYVWVALLIVLVNVAFLGIVWHAARMVLTPADAGAARGETSWWMVGAMAACLVVVVALGLHLPGTLSQLLHSASTLLTNPSGA
jgi:hydrogenase-4 component F